MNLGGPGRPGGGGGRKRPGGGGEGGRAEGARSGGGGRGIAADVAGDEDDPTWEDAVIVAADRVKAKVMDELLAQAAKEVRGNSNRQRGPDQAGIRSARWVQ